MQCTVQQYSSFQLLWSLDTVLPTGGGQLEMKAEVLQGVVTRIFLLRYFVALTVKCVAVYTG